MAYKVTRGKAEKREKVGDGIEVTHLADGSLDFKFNRRAMLAAGMKCDRLLAMVFKGGAIVMDAPESFAHVPDGLIPEDEYRDLPPTVQMEGRPHVRVSWSEEQGPAPGEQMLYASLITDNRQHGKQ
jgi:hypothetical protein